MSGSVQAKARAKSVVKAVWRAMEQDGFVGKRGGTIWRRSNVKFDLLAFDVITAASSHSRRAAPGTFMLDASCLFPFLPRIGYQPRDVGRLDKGCGQFRLSVLGPLTGAARVHRPLSWCVAEADATDDELAADCLATVRKRLLPMFSRFDDPSEVLRTLIEDEDATASVGVWEIGKRDSLQRLLYTGFAALECENWSVAQASLTACRQKLRDLPGILTGRIAVDFLPLLDQADAHAARQSRWSLPSGGDI